VVVLGSGYPAPNPYRRGPSLAVIVDDFPYFVDCGEGVWRAMAHAVLSNGDWLGRAFELDNLRYLFLTHLHEDHTVGIPSWILSPYKYGCTTNKDIFGPDGTGEMIGHILKAWHIDTHEMQVGSPHASKNGSKALTHDIKQDGKVFEDHRVKVFAYRTKHGALKNTFAFRFETPDRTFAFGGDGNFSDGLVKAAKNADILFVEACTFENLKYATWGGDDIESKRKTVGAYHLFPESLVKLKKASGVKEVVLIHEQNYAPPGGFSRLGLLREIKRSGFKGPIQSSIDGDVY
jgi:ribonuclease BN (tRNA processing enzyme)